MIKKVAKGYEVASKTTGKNLGVSKTKQGAIKREKQILYFKYLASKKKK